MLVVWVLIALALVVLVVALALLRLGSAPGGLRRSLALARRDLGDSLADSAAEFRDWIRLGR